MNNKEFVELVKNRAKLSSDDEAVNTIRATLETLGERLGNEAQVLADKLPEEIRNYIGQPSAMEEFSVDEFFSRVAKREGVTSQFAVHHARAVIAAISKSILVNQMENFRTQFPAQYTPLFVYAV